MLGVIEFSQIFEVIWVSLVAGVAITASYSFVVLGSGRSAEARRAGHTGAAIGYGALAAAVPADLPRRVRLRHRSDAD